MKPRLKLVKGYKMPQEPPPSELDEAIARFLLARKALEAKTQLQYRRTLEQFRQIAPDWPPTPAGLIAFIELSRKEHSEQTTYTYYAIIRTFIRFLVKRRLIPDDPLDEISPPRRPGVLPRAPLVDQLKKLIDYLESQVEKVLRTKSKPYEHWGWHRVRNMCLYSLLLDTGLRVSEVVNVRLSDVNIGAEEWYVFVRKGKGNKQRIVPLARTSKADISFWLEYRALIPIGPDEPGRDYLFVAHRRGWQPMAAVNVKNTLAALCRKAGISNLTPHQLRHGFASMSHDNGMPIGRIQQILGHTEPGTTMRYLLVKESLKEHLASSPRDHQL